MDIKQRLREARWAWWLPAAFFAGICLLPSGHIEASPGEFLNPPVWMAPMAWPLLAMAVLFAGAAFSERLRRRAWHIVFIGAGASLLFELVFVASSGSAALYSRELGTDLRNRIFVDFELDLLAFGILPMDLLLVAVSFLVLWVRHGRPAPPEPGPLPFSALPPAAPPPADAPALSVPADAPPSPQVPAEAPAAPPPPPDAIAPKPPAPAPQNEAPAAGPATAAILTEPVAPGPTAPAPLAEPLASGPTIGAPPPDAPAPRPGPAPEAIPPEIPPAPTAPPGGQRAQKSGPSSQFPKQ